MYSTPAAEERHHTGYNIIQRTTSRKHDRPRILPCVSHGGVQGDYGAVNRDLSALSTTKFSSWASSTRRVK